MTPAIILILIFTSAVSFSFGMVTFGIFTDTNYFQKRKCFKIIAEEQNRLYKNIKRDYKNITIYTLKDIVKKISDDKRTKLIEESKELIK